MARPRATIDPDKVEMLARAELTHEEIAAELGCSVDTLTRRFADSIKKGRERGNGRIRARQYDLAMKGNVALLIWLGKQRLGQRERIDYRNVSDDDLITEAERLFGGDFAARAKELLQPAERNGR